MGDGLVSTSAQGPHVGGGSGLSGLHGHSLVLVVVVTTGGVDVDCGGATASVVVISGGGAAGACVVVVVVVVVVVAEDGSDELDPFDDDEGLEVPAGATVIQVEPGFVGSPDCFPEPSRSTPSSTPANADAATAEPHAAQSTRTASSFAGITRTSRGEDSSETVQGVRLGINASAELNRAIPARPERVGTREPIDLRGCCFSRRRADREEWFDDHPDGGRLSLEPPRTGELSVQRRAGDGQP
jgi:hypothetical protein